MLHPAVEMLVNYLNDESKPYTPEKLTKLCSSMVKEDKDFFTKKIKENVSREELVTILKNMTKPGPKPEGN